MKGKLEDVITYLEMTSRPPRPRLATPAGMLALMRAEHCTISFYRYLYNTVGEDWLWFERRKWSDERLAETIAKPGTEIFVLHVGGVPAGFYEFARADQAVELAYFGLIPQFIGRGYGTYLLQTAIDNAFQSSPRRLWTHTCTYDHPRALGVYQRAGFRVYERRPLAFNDPRRDGTLPRSLKHPLLPPLPNA